MANGGASAKIYIEAALVDNFKQISSTLKNGLGKSLKELQDMDLKFGFDSEDMAKAASEELATVTKLLSTSKFNKLDFSAIIPSLTSALTDDSLKDNIKLQVIQGLREGLTSFGQTVTVDEIGFLRHAKGREGAEGFLGAIYGSMSVEDIINSFGIDDKSKEDFRQIYGKAVRYFLQRNPTEGVKSIAQLRSLKEASNQGYDDILKFLVSPNQAESKLEESLDIDKLAERYAKRGKVDISNEQMADVVGYIARLQDLKSLNVPDAEAALESLTSKPVMKAIMEKIDSDGLLQDAFNNIRQRVIEGGQIKDSLYAQLTDPKVFMDYVNKSFGAFNILAEVLEDSGNIRKILPLITGEYETAKGVSADELLADTLSLKPVKEGSLGSATEQSEQTAERAEHAAETAEDAVERIEKAVSDTPDETKQEEKQDQENTYRAENSANQADKTVQKADSTVSSKAKDWEKQLKQDEKALLKAKKKLEELEKEETSLSKEREALDSQIENQNRLQQEKASQVRDLNEKHNAQKKDITQKNKDQQTLNKRIESNSKNVKSLEGRIEEIRGKKAQLTQEYKEYQKQAQNFSKEYGIPLDTEYISTQRDFIASDMGNKASKATLLRNEKTNLEQIKDAKLTVDGKDMIEVLREKAKQTKENKAKLEQAKKELENATDENREELKSVVEKANQDYLKTKIELLRGFRDAQKNGIQDSDLSALLLHGSEEYGLGDRFVDIIKEGQDIDTEKLQKALQLELESVLKPIRKTIKEREAELEKINKEIEEQRAKLGKLSQIEGVMNKTSSSKKKLDKLENEEGGLQSQKTRLQTQIETDKKDLARPRYTDLSQKNAEFEKEEEELNKLRKERDEAKKEHNRLTRQATKKDARLDEIRQEKIKTQSDIDSYTSAIENDKAQIETAQNRDNNPSSESQGSEEVAQVQKTRKELQTEREKLAEEIQHSEATAKKAQQEIEKIDKTITSTNNHLHDNKYVRRPSFVEAKYQAQQKEEELRQTSEELENVTKKKQELENQLQKAIKAQKVQKNAQAWIDYIDGFTGEGYEEFDILKNIPFTEKNKPQKQKATNELKRIGQLYLEHRKGTGDYSDQDNGLWQDAYTVLHHRAMEQAKKHQVADSTLNRERFDTDDESFYQESLQKLKEEREFYRKIYDEKQEILDQNFEQMQQLNHLRYREKELQESQKQQQKELISAQRTASGFEELENDIQNEENKLDQLKKQRDKQQAIYDEAKAIQEEKAQQLEELNRLIAETEVRESASSAITQEKPVASSEFPVSSSGNQTADGIRQEGDEAKDTASKMEALAKAKKEALEANQKLAESADKTNDALKGEGNSANSAEFDALFLTLSEIHELLSQFPTIFAQFNQGFDATPLIEQSKSLIDLINEFPKDGFNFSNENGEEDFSTLILALTEIYELLSQLPQALDGLKNLDLSGVTEPLNNLSETIKELPKEDFKISLGDSFDNLANRIDEVLQKLQEFTSEIKTKEVENTIAKQYDEQIKQLTVDLKEAKKTIEELKKAQIIKQTPSIDEYDPALDSATTRTKKRNVAKRASKQQTPEIDPLAKEYGLLYQAQQESFKANNIDEYNAALEKSESILQRINELEQKIFSDYGKNPYQDELLSRNYSQLLQDNSQNKSNVPASKNSIENFVEKQKAEIQDLENSINNIQLIPEEAQTNWNQTYIDKYNAIKESAQEVTTTVQILKETLAQASATGLDQNTLRAFLEFKQTATEQVASTQKEDNNFKSNIVSISNEYISRLSEIEGRLMAIKTDSEKLINIDPSIANTLIFVEQYLGKIKELKDNVSKNPLEIYNSDVRGHIDTTIADLTSKKETENGQSVLEQMEQVSIRSQTNLERIVNNYSRYSTALNKLYKDIAKGSKSSSDELEKDFARINDFSSKIADSTGLAQEAIIKGELKPEASPKIVDAQTEAANKTAIAFEGMYTTIEAKAESARNKIENIFGSIDITKGLQENFVGGTIEGFDQFAENAKGVGDSLEHLEEIQKTIKKDNTWLLQAKNAEELRQTIATLETSLAQVSKESSNFKIVNDLDVQELRASTKQYIRDNPALTGGEVSELNNYIDQLQNKINTVDFRNIEDGIKSVQQTAKEAGHTGETFMSMLTQRFKSLGAYLLSFVSFYEVVGVFKEGINIVHELDDALTEMQKVSDESLSSLKEYQKTTFDTANNIGTTAQQLQVSTADWMRLGESLQEASQSAQTANVLFNVSEFESIDEATTALVAMSAAYADAEKDIDKMDIVDRLNLIGNNYAIATDELATALQDGAATLQTAGNDLDQAIALTTAGNEKIA